jgi:hypothetical protein
MEDHQRETTNSCPLTIDLSIIRPGLAAQAVNDGEVAAAPAPVGQHALISATALPLMAEFSPIFPDAPPAFFRLWAARAIKEPSYRHDIPSDIYQTYLRIRTHSEMERFEARWSVNQEEWSLLSRTLALHRRKSLEKAKNRVGELSNVQDIGHLGDVL